MTVKADLSGRPAFGKVKAKVNVINSSGTIARLQLVVLAELKLFDKYSVELNILNVANANKILAGLIGRGDGDLCAGSGFSGLFPAIEKGATVKIVAGTIVAPTNAIFSGKPVGYGRRPHFASSSRASGSVRTRKLDKCARNPPEISGTSCDLVC